MYHMANSSLTSSHDVEVTYAYSGVDTNGVTGCINATEEQGGM